MAAIITYEVTVFHTEWRQCKLALGLKNHTAAKGRRKNPCVTLETYLITQSMESEVVNKAFAVAQSLILILLNQDEGTFRDW